MEAIVTLRFDLRKGENLPELRYQMRGAMTASWNTAGWYCTTGHGPDLWTDTQNAVRYMIDWLKQEHGLNDHEAPHPLLGGDGPQDPSENGRRAELAGLSLHAAGNIGSMDDG